MKKILIMGAGISQAPTMRACKKLGVFSVVVDGSPNAHFIHEADKFILCDIKDHEAVLKIAEQEKVDGIVCPGTDFPYVAAYVAHKLNLPGINPSVALMCQNKYEQRKVLKQGGFFVPPFVSIKNKEEISAVETLNLPIVIKPVDSMAARGSRVVHNYKELFAAYIEAVSFSRSKEVIAEEFVEGMEFSIDSLSFVGEVHVCGFADRHFMLYPYFIENGHTIPSALDEDTINYINDEYKKAVKYLGIDLGAAKGDIKLTSKGIMIGEIAARISGGFLSGWTYPLSSGVFPHINLVKLHLGEPTQSMIEQQLGFSAERVLMSIPGRLKDVINLEKARKYPGVKLIHLHVRCGDELNFPSNNAKRCGSVITYDRVREDAIHQAQIASSDIVLRLEARNPLTIKWMEEENSFRMYSPAKKELDWHDADIARNLQKIKNITGTPVREIIKAKNFWDYFYKGGVQGGIFAIDSQ